MRHTTGREWTLNDLSKTLPPRWNVYKTEFGRWRFIFAHGSSTTSWVHLDPSFDMSSLPNRKEDPPPGLQPAYEALSYMWGSESDTQDISVNYILPSSDNTIQPPCRQGVLSIRSNLAAALRALRYPEQARTLWIDSLCINQKDFEKRGAQIQTMGSIYRTAQRVVVWLGNHSSSTSEAMNTLDYLGSQVEVTDGPHLVAAPGARQSAWYRRSLPYNRTLWQSIGKFLQRPWFMRLWVWQKITLANSKSLIVCGSYQMSWLNLHKAILRLYNDRNIPTNELRQTLEVSRYLTSTSSSLGILLMAGRQRHCADPKDHMYGISSMCKQKWIKHIVPRYNTRIEFHEVFQEVFVKCLHENLVLNFLPTVT